MARIKIVIVPGDDEALVVAMRIQATVMRAGAHATICPVAEDQMRELKADFVLGICYGAPGRIFSDLLDKARAQSVATVEFTDANALALDPVGALWTASNIGELYT